MTQHFSYSPPSGVPSALSNFASYNPADHNYGASVEITTQTISVPNQIPTQTSPCGLVVDDYLAVQDTDNIWAIGDCAITKYAPTAQVASQEGVFLGHLFNTMAKTEALETELKDNSDGEHGQVLRKIQRLQKQLQEAHHGITPFEYSHQGSLAYIGKERAVADISWPTGNIASAGTMTYLF
ncbi:uncharacterized protein N7459_003598 [Penicillium hispanicum]|uniref:uncharacterized protein n=1 Tax=Penicillium hispanicum TaxID=1080232 RepID=UPI0025416C3A|nr:uncharacterized protein N7459_003598 [Penicillium hispanicum]KAJ5587833.1 hypothetical protein N7459_003598 [Penicillium hispanicum]